MVGINQGCPSVLALSNRIRREAIGLKDHLSPTRSNGLLAMVKQVKAYALAYTMK